MNPGPPDYKSSALTTRPRRRLTRLLTRGMYMSYFIFLECVTFIVYQAEAIIMQSFVKIERPENCNSNLRREEELNYVEVKICARVFKGSVRIPVFADLGIRKLVTGFHPQANQASCSELIFPKLRSFIAVKFRFSFFVQCPWYSKHLRKFTKVFATITLENLRK